jgi:hypothetical protein
VQVTQATVSPIRTRTRFSGVWLNGHRLPKGIHRFDFARLAGVLPAERRQERHTALAHDGAPLAPSPRFDSGRSAGRAAGLVVPKKLRVAIHIVVWEPDKRKVVKLNMPFWLLRMTKGHPIKISSDDDPDADPVHLRITAEDLEKRGSGLILDHKEASGERVLVWAQ